MEVVAAERLNRTDNVQALKATALELALQHGVVWPGLTAIVSLPDGLCRTSDEVPQSCDAMDGETAMGDRQGATVGGLLSSSLDATGLSCTRAPVAMVIAACLLHAFALL